jgi:hypothetical protein
MSDTDLLANFFKATTRVVAKANEVEDDTADALGEVADAAVRIFTRLFED